MAITMMANDFCSLQIADGEKSLHWIIFNTLDFLSIKKVKLLHKFLEDP